jgi:hypothetical protein
VLECQNEAVNQAIIKERSVAAADKDLEYKSKLWDIFDKQIARGLTKECILKRFPEMVGRLDLDDDDVDDGPPSNLKNDEDE